MTATENVHPHEIHKFGSQAERWWDPNGEFKTLHDVNPLRLQFIQQYADLSGKRVVDVGCGGGILTEGLAKAGADALGVDLSEDLLDIADLHGLETGVNASYRKISAEQLAEEQPAGFDHVTCMEMLEHVPDPASIIAACATLVKPGGMVFFSTLNRVPKAWLLAIVAAEHVLKMVPKGTHDYKTFIKPSELGQMARSVGLELQGMVGIEYSPFSKRFSLGKDIDVNYIAAFQRPE
ncbi:bifunctional 2-polyprenyl-6-hydroxyphenol methylase/3-demethylubiquinol 3-O-methyltransferase UbiG [Methylomonas sp. LW13]|uniref:bifunctional 2-polyprenyl-6-hydroxyphenol methylase/3-demethylubiquinol 3-O-methyltransferase UbiG n=1 Tax=unclassified Methylomonas TaxID=2608980 RepID=UPI000A037471|nr:MULTISPECIES: bifunctional 2-polyprenyl-6-hydroxyphenol methylase/3-demethylubiquinol 3-O-methyltransferase UbiG [unclassified Methylomonas]PKD37977.1 bifunctional 2-polyprenyl-6-hydroxyphenol methylase/3-demethylubiquinol 3-O-methyltransferase UbiG [Methylomonas sp. Kb3]QBC28273.1 bifunctional 2-polyprenyl-6-hydroxyphenol methylase/3-demethylubiquinol 3-O-methyltransferase UbiG [Methylomonas sp. LW13]